MASYTWPNEGGGSGGVTSLNTLTGNITLAAGSNITLTPSGNTITIASTGGGVTSVALTGMPGISVSGSPITTSGTLALSITATQTISASAIDWSTGVVFQKSIGSTNTTFTFSNTSDGQTINVYVTATTGTVTWPTVKWSGGTPPTRTASGTDLWSFIKVGSVFVGSVIFNVS